MGTGAILMAIQEGQVIYHWHRFDGLSPRRRASEPIYVIARDGCTSTYLLYFSP